MEESLSEYYYKQLENSSNKVPILIGFYKALFDIENVDSSAYKYFARLQHIYGYRLVYFALLDCADMQDTLDHERVGRLISYFCKKRLMEKINPIDTVSLEALAKKNLKELTRKRNLKIPQVDFEEKNEVHPHEYGDS